MELYWIDAASIAPVAFKSPTSENDKMPLARYVQSVIRGLWTRHTYHRIRSNGQFLMFATSKKTIEQVAPKVIKRVTPWWIRWFYSIFGDRVKMATASIAPDGINASDSVVCVLFSLYYCMNHSWYLIDVSFQLKSMDANRYATKKTIAQGMLDIALLTANASQLKYILQVGHQHEFYTLMLILISVSIIMQVIWIEHFVFCSKCEAIEFLFSNILNCKKKSIIQSVENIKNEKYVIKCRLSSWQCRTCFACYIE